LLSREFVCLRCIERLRFVRVDFVQVTNPSQLFKCSSSSMNVAFGPDGSLVHLDYHGVRLTFVSFDN
jgi:hypothetical protein